MPLTVGNRLLLCGRVVAGCVFLMGVGWLLLGNLTRGCTRGCGVRVRVGLVFWSGCLADSVILGFLTVGRVSGVGRVTLFGGCLLLAGMLLAVLFLALLVFMALLGCSCCAKSCASH